MKKKQLWRVGMLCGAGVAVIAALNHQAQCRACRRRRAQRIRTGI